MKSFVSNRNWGTVFTYLWNCTDVFLLCPLKPNLDWQSLWLNWIGTLQFCSVLKLYWNWFLFFISVCGDSLINGSYEYMSYVGDGIESKLIMKLAVSRTLLYLSQLGDLQFLLFALISVYMVDWAAGCFLFSSWRWTRYSKKCY